jgi:hypothetical protein
MEIIDNINRLFGDNLKQTLSPRAKLKIAASCFSIYAFEALRTELGKIESHEFIFTTPTFVPGEATDKVRYASDEPLWRMNPGRPDSGMDESHRTCRIREEMAGTDPATAAEQAIGERLLSPTRLQRSVLL